MARLPSPAAAPALPPAPPPAAPPPPPATGATGAMGVGGRGAAWAKADVADNENAASTRSWNRPERLRVAGKDTAGRVGVTVMIR
ncbi:MAG: hypothetical protein EXS32_03640 [Opitutus sp.]|nr:hypothetical protein [Opitutus sp.]